jgi:hypothetical protein
MCDGLIALSVFELDYDPPAVGGWGPLFEAEGVEVVEDDVGRAAIAREDAARLIGDRRARHAFAEDQRRRMEAELAPAVVPRGLPALPGLSAAETMFAHDEADRPKSLHEQLLDEELARGRV